PLLSSIQPPPPPPQSTLFPYTTLFRSPSQPEAGGNRQTVSRRFLPRPAGPAQSCGQTGGAFSPPRIASTSDHPCPRRRRIRARRSEEHTSELQSRFDLVCRLLLEKKKN